jgi:ribose transport system permease protein
MESTSKARKFFRSKTFTLIILLAVIIIFFTAVSKGSFLTIVNFKGILNAMVLYTLLAIAEACLIISGHIDLSPGYVGTTAGVLLANLLANTGTPWFLAILIALALGIAFGLFNAFLINELGFQGFIATLATGSFIAKGLTFIIASGKSVAIKDPVVLYIGTGKIGDFIPVSIIIALLAILLYGIMLAKTKFGRTIYLCGGNVHAAKLSGLNPRRLSYILFANSGMLGALAGCILAGRLKSGNTTGTNNYAFTAITAAILGGISFGGGAGGMLGCFLGLLIMNGFNNGLTVLGINPYWQTVASGLLLLLALTFDYFTAQRAKRVGVVKAKA